MFRMEIHKFLAQISARLTFVSGANEKIYDIDGFEYIILVEDTFDITKKYMNTWHTFTVSQKDDDVFFVSFFIWARAHAFRTKQEIITINRNDLNRTNWRNVAPFYLISIANTEHTSPLLLLTF